MNKKLCSLAGLITTLALVSPASALADMTLGTTTPPTGPKSGIGDCFAGPSSTPDAFVQQAQDPSTPYFVPAGTGEITSWSTDTQGDTTGEPLTFLVLRPASDGSYTVVGADTETITTSSGVATFTLSTPIAVQGGDVLGLYSSVADSVACYFYGGSTPADASITALLSSKTPTGGVNLPPDNATGSSGGGYEMDVSATLIQREDAGVTTTGDSSASTGQTALLSSTVTNDGPDSAPITFTDKVPSGLTIDAVVAGNGTCSTSGQTVTCTISGLPPGQSGPVDVIVTPSAAGSYTNTVTVAPPAGVPDANSANNSATATLKVVQSKSLRCVVPNLKGIALGQARTLLRDLGCKVKVSHAHSKSVKKGSVVKTKPGKGSYAYQRTVTLVISSGPKKKHHKK